MSTTEREGRKIGKNQQPPCRRCGPAPTDTMIQQKNQSCTTNSKLDRMGLFFTDPASYPGTSQSPFRSPTSFNFLFESPKQGSYLWSPKITSSLIPAESNVSSFSAFGQVDLGVGTSEYSGSIIVDTLPTLVNPTQIWISLPTIVENTQQVLPSVSNVNITCAPNPTVTYNPEPNLVLIDNLNYFQVNNVNLLVGQQQACTIIFDVIITNA
jgi:hypothetical protein